MFASTYAAFPLAAVVTLAPNSRMLEATVLVVSVLTPRLRGSGGNRRPPPLAVMAVAAVVALLREALDVDGRGRLLEEADIDDA